MLNGFIFYLMVSFISRHIIFLMGLFFSSSLVSSKPMTLEHWFCSVASPYSSISSNRVFIFIFFFESLRFSTCMPLVHRDYLTFSLLVRNFFPSSLSWPGLTALSWEAAGWESLHVFYPQRQSLSFVSLTIQSLSKFSYPA